MNRAWFLLAAALLAGGDPLMAEVRRQMRTDYYSISGRDEFELYRQMRLKGPQDYGRHALARTYTKAGYRVRMRGNGRECRVHELQIDARFRIVLPRLAAATRLPARVMDNWHDLARRIHAHEMQHVKIYMQCLRTMERRMQQMRGRNCRELKAKLRAFWKQAAADCKQRQKDFDARSKRERRHIPFYRALARQVRERGERP